MEKAYKIQSKFVEHVLFPSNAVDKSFFDGTVKDATFETTDGFRVRAEFLNAIKNSDGENDVCLDDICLTMFSMPFNFIRSMWISRLGMVDEFWYLVKLNKVE